VFDRRQVTGELIVAEEPPIREEVNAGGGKLLFACLEDPDEVSPKERGLPSGDPKLTWSRLHEVNEAEMLVNAISVVNGLGRLRAHEAEAVAAISCEESVVRRTSLVESSNEATRIENNYIAVLKMIPIRRAVYRWQSRRAAQGSREEHACVPPNVFSCLWIKEDIIAPVPIGRGARGYSSQNRHLNSGGDSLNL
jgi:hypothetical protein